MTMRNRFSIAGIAPGVLIAGLAGAIALAGCSGGGDPIPEARAETASPITTATFGLGSKNEGERLYGQECAICHVGKATGTMMLGRRLGKDQAELHKRTDLDPDFVKAVVRNGLVNMPPFSRVEVTDSELDKIAAWLARKDR